MSGLFERRIREFEKRLKMLSSYATPFTLSKEEQININWIISQLQRINAKNLKKVVAEAAKEFPFKLNSGTTDSKKALVECYNWFVRWFSSQEQEAEK